MPEGEIPLWLLISADGTVQYNRSNPSDWKTAEYKAACIPAHGRLIDADALGEFPYNMDFCDGYEADEWVQNAPTVIPASE